MGAQIVSQIDKVAPPKIFLNFMGVPSLGPDLLMHFAHPLAHFWLTFGTLLVLFWYLFGTLLVPTGSLFLHFDIIFIVFLAFNTDL